MKLAEALVLRADYQKRMELLKARMIRNAKVQEGDQPAEDSEKLLSEYESIASDLVTLIEKINLTNARCNLGGKSMTRALAERDTLKLRYLTHAELAKAATITQTVSTRSEVRFRSTISVAEVQKTADSLAKELRELDARIQEANWSHELLV